MARDKQVTKIGQEIRAQLSAMVSGLMLTAAAAVERACPVQTGHLLSNFILSTGSPYRGVAGSPESVTTGPQEAGKDKVRKYDVGRDGRIYLTNHVEYLRYLPPFVTQALMSAVQSVPRGRRSQARSMLKSMAKTSFRRGA